MTHDVESRPKVISRDWLDDHGACRDQVQRFERTWPDGVTVTRETLERSATAGLSLEWFVRQVLPHADYADYFMQRDALFAAYMQQRDTLKAAYDAQFDAQEADYLALIRTLGAAWQAQYDALLVNITCDLYQGSARVAEEDATLLPS